MAVDTNFMSSLQNLKVEDPWLPPRPWESIPSESGISHSNTSTSQSSLSKHLYRTSTVSEDSLVRLGMNALQGMESAILSIEKLCAAFCCEPADRTFHRIPSLWNRSSSTLALANMLKSIGRSGCVILLLRKFIDYFAHWSLNDNNSVKNRQVNSEGDSCPPYCLVNQAFAAAVGKVSNGYTLGLDTLYASVGLRRSSKTDSGVGCLTSVGHSEITLLEVYLHTKELRTQIEALGSICNVHDVALCFSVACFEDLSNRANSEFGNFPRGGDLLTYLYRQLKVVDPAHRDLLKFLFLQSFEPYYGFIRSWIYEGMISDPYKEFIVDCIDKIQPCSRGKAGLSIDFPLAAIRERDGVAVPCFLKDFSTPLFRAGQQLQVLMKLLDLCSNVDTWNRTYDNILPCWGGWSSDSRPYLSPLIFNKGSVKAATIARNDYYIKMLEKLEILLTNLEFRYQQVVPPGIAHIFGKKSDKSLNIPVSFAAGGTLISPSANERDPNLSIFNVDCEASSVVDEDDALESSECSSLNSSDEQNGSEHLPHGMVELEQKYLSALSFSSSIAADSPLQKPSNSRRICAVESDLRRNCKRTDPVGFVHVQCAGTSLSDNSSLSNPGEFNLPNTFEILGIDSQYAMGWPLGGLLENPFYVDQGNIDDTELYMYGYGLNLRSKNLVVKEEGTSNCREEGASNCNNLILSRNDQIETTNMAQPFIGTCILPNSPSLQSWNLRCHSNFLSMNPILSKSCFNHLRNKPAESGCTDYREPLSFFDFACVKDPCQLYLENFRAHPRRVFVAELSVLTDSVASADMAISNCHEKEGYSGDDVSVDKLKPSYACLPSGLKSNDQGDVRLASVSGGGSWQSLLSSSSNCANIAVRDHRTSLPAEFQIPLDFVIEKCLLEEILLQYRYLSTVTIKLLEEGFSLREHLLALRRYHFMEFADWADSFIMSLWNHKWYATEAEKRIPEIQGFLELSVQRSSCESDLNKDRLYVYMKGHGTIICSASATGIRSFDFLGLGYKVDWPVSLILSADALKIYAEIFTFLIQVKLAVFSLTDVWCSLKVRVSGSWSTSCIEAYIQISIFEEERKEKKFEEKREHNIR
ncbi:unnamed protein product [Ilex paraguariensis]|uniref:Gamma-tubulin complex component n=1 Tax=Ilex paraguariensis TaxID=185542 RepID=A0ABC8RY13_9AQUA